jgi:hypothetical protein
VIVPLRDARAAADEIERCAALGARSVSFTEDPPSYGFPSISDADGYWDPFFRACNDTGVTISIQQASSASFMTQRHPAEPDRRPHDDRLLRR